MTIENDLLSPSELDPLGLHLPPVSARYIPASQKIQFRPHHRDSMIQVALISSTSRYETLSYSILYGTVRTYMPSQILYLYMY